MDIPQTLASLAEGIRLPAVDAELLFDQILSGRADDAQIGAILGMMQVRGVADSELLGASRSMRRHAVTISTQGISGVILDTCGTGGAPKTFNVSTVAALVVAAAAPGQISVAKHGNRSRTGRGSAEVLERLGVNIGADVRVQSRCLRECGVCFCFAIQHHPAAKHAAQPRRSLAFPTIFNLLGPLCNPAHASHQMLGVFSSEFVEPMARTLAALGSKRAIVMHGHGGMDEFSTTGPTRVSWVHEGNTTSALIDAAEFGIPRADPKALVAANLDHGVRIADEVLSGVSGACRDIVCASAGLALHVGGAVADIAAGVDLAKQVIDSGKARQTLASLVRLSHESV
ncbi:MAG: anthranilate phosphoribosyltransferase [Planctomycetota bacterium]|nr:anthranilate phosphoribosyltransferase [Planctomycetota bacterium]